VVQIKSVITGSKAERAFDRRTDGSVVRPRLNTAVERKRAGAGSEPAGKCIVVEVGQNEIAGGDVEPVQGKLRARDDRHDGLMPDRIGRRTLNFATLDKDGVGGHGAGRAVQGDGGETGAGKEQSAAECVLVSAEEFDRTQVPVDVVRV